MNASGNRTNHESAGGQAGLPALMTDGVGEIVHTPGAREVGTLLIVSGIAGIILPGPVGTPLLIMGCVMIWPAAFRRIDRFFARKFPRTHQLGALQSERFLRDLKRRYPGPR